MANLNVRINNKYDSYENWMNSSLVLGAGEIAVAYIESADKTGLTPPAIGVKIGDGQKTFSQLNWIQATAGDVHSWAKAAVKPEYDASEIKNLSQYISGEIQDTDTQYKLVKVDDYNYKLQSKALDGAWTDVEGSSFVIPKYDDTEVRGLITGIKTGATINDFAAVEAALAGKQATGDYALNSTVSDVSDRVAAVEGDYLKAADKTELEGKITTAQNGVNEIKGDYLKAADKTELSNLITGIKDGASIDSFADVEAALAGKQATGDYALNSTVTDIKDRVDAIEGDYLTSTDKTEMSGKITAAHNAANAAQEGVNDIAKDYLKAADKTELEGKIAAAQTAADDAQDDVDALADKVGTVAEGKTVVGMIGDLEDVVDEHGDAISALEGSVETLVGEDANKSVRTIANEELAKQLIPADAAEALNELQEIAAWIQAHPGDASAMNAAILALQNQVKGIDAGEGTVKKYIDDAIAALNVGQYALAADLTALAGRVSTLEGEMAQAQTDIEANAKAVSDLDGSLAAIAKTGNVADLVQTAGTVLIFDCGTSAV